MTAVSIHRNVALAADFADGTPWPLLTGYGHDHEVTVDGVGLAGLAQEYGTPLQVISEAEVRERAAEYVRAFAGGDVAYASKAFLTSTMARWMMDEGLGLDVCSGGELALADAVGVPMDRILMHGNAKSPQELADAHRSGVGRIVVDSRTEISQLAALGHSGDGHRRQRVLLRVLPGVSGHTHRSVDTGREDQQFGFSLSSGAALEAVRRVLGHPELELAGLHCHIGSQIADPEAYLEAARRMIALLARIRDLTGVVLPELDLGGGHAVAYRAGDPELAPAPLAAALRETIDRACLVNRFPLPRLTIEPGRAIVARAGVTLYRVITVKRTADGALFVAVDGGMSDNPRPSLYHAGYTVRLIGRATHGPAVPATVVGRHCEAGDVLVQDAELPGDIRPGDLLVMLCTGAYQHSMASNYNMVRRSPVVSVRGGQTQVLIRRETDADLMRRDLGLSGETGDGLRVGGKGRGRSQRKSGQCGRTACCGGPGPAAARRAGGDPAWSPAGGEIAYRRGPCPPLMQVWREQARAALVDAFTDAMGGFPDDVPIRCVLSRGDTGPALVAAADRASDLLVVGVGRQGLLAALQRRSVSHFCLKNARCPVLAVPEPTLMRELRRSRKSFA